MKYSNHNYNPKLIDYAYELRTHTVSRAEKFLWQKVLSRNQQGVKFKRQRPIGNFIVDFFSQEIGLVIEIDGNSHIDKGSYDSYRENKLKEFGLTVVRFSEGNVLNNIGEVITQLQHVIYCLKEEL